MENLTYQPDPVGHISLSLPRGTYDVEFFDDFSSSISSTTLDWDGGTNTFLKPEGFFEDWILLVKTRIN